MTDKPYADVDKALATFGAAPIKYRSFGSPVLRPAARVPLAPPADLPDEPEYDPVKASTPPPVALAPIAPPVAVPPPVLPPPARPDHRPAMRSGPVVAQPPPTAAEPRHADLSESASKLFPLLAAALPEAADVMVAPDAPSWGRDGAGGTGAAAPPPVYQAPPMPAPLPVPHAAAPDMPVLAAPPAPVMQPPPMPPPAIPSPPIPSTPIPSPPVQSLAPPPPAAAWPRARPEPRPQDQQTSRPAAPVPAADPPPFTSLAAHLARTGAAAAGGERPGPAGIIAAPRLSADTGPRGDHRSVAEMFRLLSAGRGDRAGQNSAFPRAGDGDSALFRRL